MKRRKFLGLFSSALAAPLVPVPALAQAGYTQASWNAAVTAARSSAAVSVGGMASLLKMTPAATEVMMRDMVAKGILGPLSAPRHGGVWAVSRVMKAGNIAALHKAHQAAQRQLRARQVASDPLEVASDWIAHLRQICLREGMTLHPRCST